MVNNAFLLLDYTLFDRIDKLADPCLWASSDLSCSILTQVTAPNAESSVDIGISIWAITCVSLSEGEIIAALDFMC